MSYNYDMEPRKVVCACGKSFEVANPRSRQAYCSTECRPERKKVVLPERGCDVCLTTFVPTYECQKYCSQTCKWTGFSKTRKVDHTSIKCETCCTEFVPKRTGKKFCSVKCSAARHGQVTNNCTICNNAFTVAYRFRGTKTCSPTCTNTSISRTLNTRETKHCLACGNGYTVVQSYKEDSKYCSYDCFLSTRKSRQPDVTRTCENCKQEFTVPFTDTTQRFCDKSCANSGIYNPCFKLLGSDHPRFGKPSWNHGQTIHTDPRIRALGEKISIIVADKMVSGSWSPPTTGYKGEHYVGQKNNGVRAYMRSSYESAYARLLDADDEVVMWEHEPMRIPYVFDGSLHNYVPDFMVTRIDDRRSLVEVKPGLLVDTPRNVAKLRAATSWCESNDVELVIVTEKDL